MLEGGCTKDSLVGSAGVEGWRFRMLLSDETFFFLLKYAVQIFPNTKFFLS